MNGRQKLYFLVDAIAGAREITPSSKDVLIDSQHDLYGKYSSVELVRLFTILEEEKKVIKDLDPDEKIGDGCFHLKILLPAFDEYYLKIQQEPEYQDFKGRKLPSLQIQSEQPRRVNLVHPVYEVKYSEQTREIRINDHLIKKLRSFSENESIFSYLYKNPNRDVSDADIKKGEGLTSIKDLNKFLEDIGFTGQLRKVFFKASKGKIRFNNPIGKEFLNELGIKQIELK